MVGQVTVRRAVEWTGRWNAFDTACRTPVCAGFGRPMPKLWVESGTARVPNEKRPVLVAGVSGFVAPNANQLWPHKRSGCVYGMCCSYWTDWWDKTDHNTPVDPITIGRRITCWSTCRAHNRAPMSQAQADPGQKRVLFLVRFRIERPLDHCSIKFDLAKVFFVALTKILIERADQNSQSIASGSLEELIWGFFFACSKPIVNVWQCQ